MSTYKLQSVLLSKSYYNLTTAIEWIHSHGLELNKVDETKDFYRFRQIHPTYLKREGYTKFITKKLNPYIDLIIAYKD